MRVHIETEVDLDLELMAKSFAHMPSDEQAKFFAMAYREMATFTRKEPDGTTKELGEIGREMQMCYINDEFDKEPDARSFINEMWEMTNETEAPKVENKASLSFVTEKTYGVIPDDYQHAVGHTCEQLTVMEDGKFTDAAAEQAHIDSLPEALEVLDMKYVPSWDSPTGHARMIYTCRPRRPAPGLPDPYAPGDRVHLDLPPERAGLPWGVRVGRCTKVNDDGTIEVLLDPSPGAFAEAIKGGSDEAILDALERGRPGFAADHVFPPESSNDDKTPESPNADKPKCDECRDTGVWTNPAGGRNADSPCSRGCPKS